MVNTSLIPYRALLVQQQLLHQRRHKRLASRIHGDLCQQLTLMSLQLSLALAADKPPANWAEQCERWSSMVLRLGRELRDIINELQPPILDEFGLAAALQWFASCPAGIECSLVVPKAPRPVPASAANELFEVFRDIVNDVFLPGGVKKMAITLDQTPDAVRLHLHPTQIEPGVTLSPKALDGIAVHERLFSLNGSVETRPDPAVGFTVTLSLPLKREPMSRAA
jgi:signal transduction histidine kinase